MQLYESFGELHEESRTFFLTMQQPKAVVCSWHDKIESATDLIAGVLVGQIDIRSRPVEGEYYSCR